MLVLVEKAMRDASTRQSLLVRISHLNKLFVQTYTQWHVIGAEHLWPAGQKTSKQTFLSGKLTQSLSQSIRLVVFVIKSTSSAVSITLVSSGRARDDEHSEHVALS